MRQLFCDKYSYTDFHELNLDWVVEITADTASRLKVIEEEFAKIKVLTREEILDMINERALALKAEVESYTDEEIAKVTLAYQKYVRDQLTIFKVYVDDQDTYYLTLSHQYSDDKYQQAIEYVDDIIKESNFMFNPLSGKYEDVRVVTNDIINNYLKNKAITAGAYDALHKTAGAYDALNLTAYEYDFNATDYLM